MADHDDSKDSERDSDSDEDRDSDSEVESEPAPAKVEPNKAVKVRADAKRAPVAAAPVKSGSLPNSTAGLLVLLALAGGAAAGWFGQIQQAKAAALKTDAAAPSGSGAIAAGPCGVWQEK